MKRRELHQESGKASDDKLLGIGKMKGELNGEFEMFYLAVDGDGQLFANHDLTYSEKAYAKSADWKQISRDTLSFYEKHLHFIPLRSRGLKR